MSHNKPAPLKTFTHSTIMECLEEWAISPHDAPKELETIADYLEENNYDMSGTRVIDALIMLIEIGNGAIQADQPLNALLNECSTEKWEVNLWGVEWSKTENGHMQINLTLKPEFPIIFIITADSLVVEPNFKQRKRREMEQLKENIKLYGGLSPAIKSSIATMFTPSYLN